MRWSGDWTVPQVGMAPEQVLCQGLELDRVGTRLVSVNTELGCASPGDGGGIGEWEELVMSRVEDWEAGTQRSHRTSGTWRETSMGSRDVGKG